MLVRARQGVSVWGMFFFSLEGENHAKDAFPPWWAGEEGWKKKIL